MESRAQVHSTESQLLLLDIFQVLKTNLYITGHSNT